MKEFELRQQIISAFADVPYPGDDCLGAPDGRDDGENVTEFFRGKDWRWLKSNELWPPSLSFMTLEAFHYYLPAFLLASLEEDSGDVIDAVFYKITPPHPNIIFPHLDNTAVDEFQAKYKYFSPAQKQAVRNFIAFTLDDLIRFSEETNEPIFREEKELRALLDYWNNF
jgi:hypothetical protein